MKNKFIKFSDIKQYRNVIHDIQTHAKYVGKDDDGNIIYDNSIKAPTITFNGTVKLHGTNSGVVFNPDNDMWVQSRRQIITPEKDNAGFAFFVESHKDIFKSLHTQLLSNKPELSDKVIAYFGEWAGGNIQKGVAINGLPKMFVIFAVKVVNPDDIEDNYYLKQEDFQFLSEPDANIYNIYDYKQYTIDIDFENPGFAQEEISKLVDEVEKECPVGKAFGKIGTGEGIVWVGWYDGQRYVFKTKGQKHSTSKVKTVASVDVEKLNSINEFVAYAVTENRLNQAIEQVFIINSEIPRIEKTGDFIRWVVNDIIKEELDTLSKNGLEPKDVNKYISKQSQTWFMIYLNDMAGL